MSYTKSQRLLLFFLGCIPVRIIYAIIQNSSYKLPFINLVISIGFLYQWLQWTPSQKGVFKNFVWWNNQRLFHSGLFFISYFYPKLLYIDVLLGIIAVIKEYQLLN